MKPPKTPPASSIFPAPFSTIGPYLPEGTYTVKLTRGKETTTAEVHIVADSKARHTAAERAEQYRTVVDAYHLVERIAFVVDAVTDLSRQASESAGKLGADDPLRKSLEGLREALSATQKKLAATKEGGLTGEIKLREKILEVYGGINGYSGKPTESQIAQLGALRKQLDSLEGDFRSTAEKAIAAANPELEKKKLPGLKLLSEEEWRKKGQEQGSGGLMLEPESGNDLTQTLWFLHVR